MIDDPLQRSWHFKQLRWTLQALAQAGSSQPPLFPEQAATADELAFGFQHWSSLVREAYAGELTPVQHELLEAIAAKMATMSRDGAEFGAELWTDAALRSSEHWADVRNLAQHALDGFDSSEAAHDEPAEREVEDSTRA